MVGVGGDDAEGLGEGFGAGVGLVAFPSTAGPPPEDAPGLLGADEPESGDGVFDGFRGTAGEGADEEEVDGVAGDALAFANFITQVDGWAMVGPEVVFQGACVCDDFASGESHF